MLDISVKPEILFNILGINITNTLFTSVLVLLFLSILVIVFSPKKRIRKSFITMFLEVFTQKSLKLIDTITQDREKTKGVLPLVVTIFIFIVTANLLSALPGFLGSFYIISNNERIPLLRSPNSDLNTTIALAIVSVISIQYYSIKELGFRQFISRFINFSSPIQFVLGIFEAVSECTKVLSFSFRLFGNVFAGEILLLVLCFLVPFILPLPFMILELFFGIVQAYIFAMLTLIFLRVSTSDI